MKRYRNMKFHSELHDINIGPWNFIQLNWSTTNYIFSISRKYSSKLKYKIEYEEIIKYKN
jgi:hypothetical protein